MMRDPTTPFFCSVGSSCIAHCHTDGEVPVTDHDSQVVAPSKLKAGLKMSLLGTGCRYKWGLVKVYAVGIYCATDALPAALSGQAIHDAIVGSTSKSPAKIVLKMARSVAAATMASCCRPRGLPTSSPTNVRHCSTALVGWVWPGGPPSSPSRRSGGRGAPIGHPTRTQRCLLLSRVPIVLRTPLPAAAACSLLRSCRTARTYTSIFVAAPCTPPCAISALAGRGHQRLGQT